MIMIKLAISTSGKAGAVFEGAPRRRETPSRESCTERNKHITNTTTENNNNNDNNTSNNDNNNTSTSSSRDPSRESWK